MTNYLYRVRTTAYPNGAFEPDGHPEDETLVPVPGWSPPGWKPEGNYVEMFGTSQFVWPTTKKLYRSHSTAKKRAQLLESFGATAVIERSSEITWPDPGESRSQAMSPVQPEGRGEMERAATGFISFKEVLIAGLGDSVSDEEEN